MGLSTDDGLMLGPDGRPQAPVRTLALDEWNGADAAEIEAAALDVRRHLQLTIGIATRAVAPSLRPLTEALTLTLVGPGVDATRPELVAVADPVAACSDLVTAVERRPRAGVALGQLLQQTATTDTLPGLAAEAAVYSMLLGGPEFAEWLATRGAPRDVPPPDGPLVEVAREDGVLTLVLSRPERRNAFSFQMREELLSALELAALDDTVERVELSGSGPAFCSGGDLDEFGTAQDLVAAYLVRLDRAPWRLVDRLRDRVTVRVHGAAVGAGIEMAAFAGRVVADPGTGFVLPELEMGLVPGAGGTVSVTRRIGRWRTAWLVLSGARLDAATALQWGLVDEIADHGS